MYFHPNKGWEVSEFVPAQGACCDHRNRLSSNFASSLLDLISYLGQRTPQLCRILHFVTCPSAPHLSPSARVLHTVLLLPALLSYSSCLRLVSQGSCWLPTGRDFVNLQLFNGKIEACHKDKSSSSLPLVQIQLCQSPWQYQGPGFSFHLQAMKEITQKLCTQELC